MSERAKGKGNGWIDRRGEVQGMLTFISWYPSEDGKREGGWVCQCECGRVVKRGSASCSRGMKNCGCTRNTYSGDIYGKLTVLERVGANKKTGNVKWKCQCECGKTISRTTRYLRSPGLAKSCGCFNPPMTLENSPAWRGGRRYSPKGYVILFEPGHPNANKSGNVFEHQKVMAEVIGRPLLPKETVHHKNGVKDDNLPGNLELWVSDHPSGQRVSDLVTWAKRILKTYDQ